MAYLFDDIMFYKIGESGFKINIKNSERDGLVINNMNNLTGVQTGKVYLLPWYDKDNPIVMYYHRPGENYDLNGFAKDVAEFSKCKRSMSYIKQNYVVGCYGVNTWDTDVEYRVLNLYVSRVKKFDIGALYKLISDYLAADTCYTKVDRQYFGLPVERQVYVPVEVVKEKEVIDKSGIKNYEMCMNVLEKVTSKIKSTNDLLDVINK
jgi:hypothetical protein